MNITLTYKQQVIALGIVTLLFLYLVWQRRISDTLLLYNELSIANEQLALASRANDEIRMLESRKILLDKMIGNNDLDNASFQEYLMSKVEGEPVQLDLFLEPHIVQQNGFEFITQQARFEGGFHDILRTVNDLEKDDKGLKIIALRFEKQTDRRTKKDRLYATCFVQSVNKK